MGRRKAKEINIYSTSAIDLFASGMGVFLFLTILTLPKIENNSKIKIAEKIKEVEALAKQLNSLTNATNDFVVKLQKQVKSQNVTMRTVASTSSDSVTDPKIKEMIQESQEVVEKMSKAVEAITSQQAKLQAKMTKTIAKLKVTTKDNKELKKKLKDSIQADGEFVAVMLQWQVPEHDLDLIVVDPSGKEHKFKKIEDSTVIADSRSGPGAEIWYFEKPLLGKYQIKAFIHGKYGNEAPSIVQATVFNNQTTKVLASMKIDKEGATETIADFQLKDQMELNVIENTDLVTN